MKHLFGLVMLIAASSSTIAAPSEADFAADMLRRLRAAMPGAELSLSPDEPLVILRKKSGSKDEAQFNLHRVFGFCQQASAADCEASKAEFAAKVSVEPPRITTASLRLIVRDGAYLQYLKEMSAKAEPLGIYEPIGEDLYALLASDGADTIALVGAKGLKELKLSREAAWAIAARQTKALLPSVPLPGQLASSAVAYEGQDYLASLLIDRDAWAKLAAEVGPKLFATVVSDQFVFVGTMADGPDLDGFRKTVAEDCAAQQRCISPNIYRFRDGRWVIAR